GAAIRILIGTVRGTGGINPEVVTTDFRHQGSFRCHSPALYMRFEKISVIANELGSNGFATVIKDLRCANQRRNMNSKGRRRIPPRFLPAILRRDRTFANEEPTCATNHFEGKEVPQSTVFPESPHQQNWKRNLV